MGVDIHMHIVKNKEIVKESIFEGRNSEWFMNLQGNGNDDAYDHFPFKSYNVSEQAPDELIKESHDEWYYGHRTVKVVDYMNWFKKYRPDRHAGWVTTYDMWRIENKGFVPNDMDYKFQLDKDDIIEDWHFVEWTDHYDCAAWLYNFLVDNKIDVDAEITYWFDC